MKKENNKHSKPVVETIINTAALALTAAGTNCLIADRDWWGFCLIAFGAGLEFYKYWGRKKEYW